MPSREEVLNQFSKALQEEISYRFELMEETVRDEREAFGTSEPMPVWDDATVYLITQDMESAVGFDAFKDEVMEWWIAKGVYKFITDERIQKHQHLWRTFKVELLPKASREAR